jgi:hypothetical protein
MYKLIGKVIYMKRSMLALMLITNIAFADLENDYKEESILINHTNTYEHDKVVKIRIGDRIKFIIKVHAKDDFMGDQTVIIANAKIDNTSDQKVKAIYSISFHDKNGKLVGCTQGDWTLNPDEDINYGSGVVFTDSQSISTITNYKLKTQVLTVALKSPL